VVALEAVEAASSDFEASAATFVFVVRGHCVTGQWTAAMSASHRGWRATVVWDAEHALPSNCSRDVTTACATNTNVAADASKSLDAASTASNATTMTSAADAPAKSTGTGPRTLRVLPRSRRALLPPRPRQSRPPQTRPRRPKSAASTSTGWRQRIARREALARIDVGRRRRHRGWFFRLIDAGDRRAPGVLHLCVG